MRKINFAPGEHYHIYNRGVNKRRIFNNDTDRWRFIFSLLYFQSPIKFDNVAEEIMPHFLRHRVLKNEATARKVVKQRSVGLQAFILMPNHFHLLVQEEQKEGISAYLQRLQNSYTKYFNTKHEESGHLFQGPFQAIHIEDNEQLLYVSAYIHRNCCGLKEWKNRPTKYDWSSYQDYAKNNRWGNLLATEIISGQFDSPREYHAWVKETGAKSSTLGVEGIKNGRD